MQMNKFVSLPRISAISIRSRYLHVRPRGLSRRIAPETNRGKCCSLVVRAASGEEAAPLRAVEGDIVTLHWACMNENGEILESSRASDEPTSFEVGAGDIVGNNIFEAFDEAVRGMALGETVGIKIEGGPWQEELMFQVPRTHEEIQRLEGRYKNQGGVQEGQIVQLSNGGMALVVSATEDEVILDANSMMAGKSLRFELELVDLERPEKN